MPPRSRQQIFEELGLLEEKIETNPYETLGLDGNFVDSLLKEDETGSAVQIVAAGMSRVLSRRYHSDVEGSGDADRFDNIIEARTRIEAAGTDQLRRWVKAERTPSAYNINKITQAADERIERMAKIVNLTMETGHDPRHFSQMRWTQGVLLHSNRSTLLMRGGNHKLEVARGERFTSTTPGMSANTFQEFMNRNEYFGLDGNKRYSAFIDETGRMSLLGVGLEYIMDVSDPLDRYRGEIVRKRRKRKNEDEFDREQDVSWAHTNTPLLITTRTPLLEERDTQPVETQLTYFRTDRRSAAAQWELALDVNGSVADHNFYRRIRHRAAAGAVALAGATQFGHSHFNIMPTSVREMVNEDAGYTPLMTPGNSLVLFDPVYHTPVITDARLLGMIGNGPQYA